MYFNKNHEEKVKKNGRYIYIGSYKKGEISKDKRNIGIKSTYIRVKCINCNHEYDISLAYLKNNTKCIYENSIAYYIEVELGKDLNKYWNWEKNNINPYYTYKNSNLSVTMKCTEKDYHDDYPVVIKDFYRGCRCPYCTNRNGKIHPKDSFGALYPEKAKHWDYKKNNKSPYEVAPKTANKYWFKCEECGKSFKRSLSSLTTYNADMVICKNCHISKGERIIKDYLINNNFYFIHDKPYFKDLLSDLGRRLRPDFILPNERVWIEYDGRQHYELQKGWQTKENFKRLQKHDELKNNYAKQHNWKLIRIPYYDFENIEEVLNNILK